MFNIRNILFLLLVVILYCFYIGMITALVPKYLRRTINSINFHSKRFLTEFANTSKEKEGAYHIPVLLEECMQYLDVRDNGLYVDCTMGGGGHTKEILERGGKVISLDQDTDAISHSSKLLESFIEAGRLEIIQSNFRSIGNLAAISKFAKSQPIDGILMDLGVSSHQINEPSRGFSFDADGPLDMRMSHSNLLSAANIVNDYSVDDIANILYKYGDETKSRQIAREIGLSRPLRTTRDLVNVINRITPWNQRSKTLARCFQALRIVVNDELSSLEEALLSSHLVLREGGRLVIMSYHSLEDRLVKNLFKCGTLDGSENSNNPWKVKSSKVVIAKEEELAINRRSRSAKLRYAEKTDGNTTSSITTKSKYNPSIVGKKQLAKQIKSNEFIESEEY